MNVKITDMEKFLQKVDACNSEVYIVYPGGGTENIRNNPLRQAELVDEWKANGKTINLVLNVSTRMDSFKLRSFAV